MKIYPEQTEKWLRMNKSAFWELFEGERKTPIYSYSDSEATIDSANDALNEVLNELANGEYKIRAKQSLKSPNNTYVTRDLVIGVSMIHTSEPTKTNGNMSEILKLHDERTQMLLDAKDREYQIRDFQNEVKKLNEKFDKL